MADFPMPNDVIEGEGTVVASTHYGDHAFLATILVLRPEPPFFRVGVWNFETLEWDGGYYEDHMNIVPAVDGEPHRISPLADPPSSMVGYQGLGGDY